jgi:hypothetical protein
MKCIAKAVVVMALSTAAFAASAADTPFPSAAVDGYSQSSVFPNVDTYKREHRDSVLNQPSTGFPASVPQEYPLSGEFPDMQTYLDIHRSDPVNQATAPTFPESLSPEPSMADEGLVPGIPGVAPYVSPERTAVGATR